MGAFLNEVFAGFTWRTLLWAIAVPVLCVIATARTVAGASIEGALGLVTAILIGLILLSEIPPQEVWPWGRTAVRRDVRRALRSTGLLASASKLHADPVEAAREAARHHPSDTIAHSLLAYAYYRTEAYEQAVEEYKTAIGLDPRNAGAHCGLGLALAALGGHAQAILSFREAISLEPEMTTPRYHLAISLRALGIVEDVQAMEKQAPEREASEVILGPRKTV